MFQSKCLPSLWLQEYLQGRHTQTRIVFMNFPELGKVCIHATLWPVLWLDMLQSNGRDCSRKGKQPV